MKFKIFPKFSRYFMLLSIVVIIASAFWGETFAKDVKLGFYDTQRLESELPFYQRLMDSIQAREKEYEQFRGNLYKDYLKYYQERSQKYNQEKSEKTGAELAQITERFQAELNNKIKEMNDQLEKKRLETETFKEEQNQAYKDKIMGLVKAVADKKKMSFVIPKDLVLFGGTDLTNDIIKKVKKDEKDNKTR